MHLLFLAQTAFSLWMLVDAIRRGAPYYWWFLVLVPFGEWAYFFAVYLPNSSYPTAIRSKLFTRRISLDQLRHALEETPSHENRVRLAQALHDERHYREASNLFVDVIDAVPEDKDALFGYARCCLAEGDPGDAILALRNLVEMDVDYADFSACYELADLLSADGGRAEAIALLERACKQSQRIGPRVRLAVQLTGDERRGEARSVLETGLRTYETSPAHIRRCDRRVARSARSMLGRL